MSTHICHRAHNRSKTPLRLRSLSSAGKQRKRDGDEIPNGQRNDEFLSVFKKQTKENTNIGSQFDANTNHGPQISKAAQEKILAYMETAKSDGADLIYGGKQSGLPDKGYCV